MAAISSVVRLNVFDISLSSNAACMKARTGSWTSPRTCEEAKDVDLNALENIRLGMQRQSTEGLNPSSSLDEESMPSPAGIPTTSGPQSRSNVPMIGVTGQAPTASMAREPIEQTGIGNLTAPNRFDHRTDDTHLLHQCLQPGELEYQHMLPQIVHA